MLNRKLLATFALFVIIFALFSLDFTSGSNAKNTSSTAGQTNEQDGYLRPSANPEDLEEETVEPESSPTPSSIPTPAATPKKTSTPKPTPTPTPTPAPPPLSNGACPISTQNCVPCQEGEQYCRTKMGETTGYLGWACQNNNPGNILAPSASSKAYKDAIIVSNGGTASCGTVLGSNNYTYMIFPTYEQGMGSLKAYIKGINNGQHSAYINTQTSCAGPETFTCGNCTLQQFFCKFAGSSTYAQSVATKMGGGVTTETLLSWVVANRLDDMANAIKQTEGFFTQ